jgi:hypothetical protein
LRFIDGIVKKNTSWGRIVVIHLPVFYTPYESCQEQCSNADAGYKENNDDTHAGYFSMEQNYFSAHKLSVTDIKTETDSNQQVGWYLNVLLTVFIQQLLLFMFLFE